MKEQSCPDCGAAMEEGFFSYSSEAGMEALKNWHRGTPQVRKAFGLILGGIKIETSETFAIRSFRCVTCGLLKSYAIQPSQ
jgi:hypothetical protein